MTGIFKATPFKYTYWSEAVLCLEVPDDGGEGGGGELHPLALVAAEEAGQVVPPLVLLHVALCRLGHLRQKRIICEGQWEECFTF